MPPPAYSTLSNIYISISDVHKALSALNPNKAMGIDGIGPKILKSCASAICIPLHHLFCLSLSSGIIPSQWKMHLITPVFKSGDRSIINNYRPISLLCCFSKVLERLVHDKLSPHITSTVSQHQFGFLRGRSCQKQLLKMLSEIYMNRARKHCTDVVYLDLRKAFDSVCHPILIKKLQTFGVTGTLLNWLINYLTGRLQLVSIRGSLSGTLPVTSGVPQGSILGPLLFLVYINDMPDAVSSSILLFADDTKCLRSVPHSIHFSTVLQEDLDLLCLWSSNNLIAFNKAKSAVLRFHASTNLPSAPLYHVNGTYMLAVNTLRDLGVTMSSDISFSEHINCVVTKAYRMLALLRHTFTSSTSISAKKQLYLALIRTLLLCNLEALPH